jgi:hypothetical protein
VGRELVIKVCNLLQINANKPSDYAKLHHHIDTNLWGIREEIVLEESRKAIIHAYSCPLRNIFRFQDCEAFSLYVRGLVDVVNPNLEWKVTKALTKGDDYCGFVISE